MGLEVFPVSDGAAVNRLADLDVAGGLDGAAAFMEIAAGVFPAETTEIEQPPRLTFQVRDHGFIVDVENETGQYPLPVVHQAVVDFVVSGDIVKVVRKGNAAPEQFFIARQTDVHGIAAAMDHLGVRQNGVDEAYIEEIGRGFVGPKAASACPRQLGPRRLHA